MAYKANIYGELTRLQRWKLRNTGILINSHSDLKTASKKIELSKNDYNNKIKWNFLKYINEA